MKILLYNTLSNAKEEFISILKNQVSIYSCGVTVYDICHIGHARGCINFHVFIIEVRNVKKKSYCWGKCH